MNNELADIGLIGLAVMGQNLVLNMNDKGFKVVVFNRTVSKVSEFLSGPAKGTRIIGAQTLKEFVATIARPRKIMLMIRAGASVDEQIEELLPFLEKGDCIIDGGNSHFPDSERRYATLKQKGILFIGSGISGGEEGARHGPSIMPGGDIEGWKLVSPIFRAIAARSEEGEICCDWVGEGGAGHYVKMVHNGIEYGDMQIICEAYAMLKKIGLNAEELSTLFKTWNKGVLSSYLIEIAGHIFSYMDVDKKPLVEKILDVAQQKGTGKWTVSSALDLGLPVTLIAEAVFARCLSSLKEERVAISARYPHITTDVQYDKNSLIQAIHDACYAAKIISYTQGFMLMQAAAKELSWHLHFGSIALMWRGGCIIRSQFLGKIKEAYDKNPMLQNLLFDEFFEKEIKRSVKGLRVVVSMAAQLGISIPCFSTALSFFDGLTTGQLPANLLQAMRDYFGAHTYERIDRPRGEFFHTNWTGSGGNVSSTTYSV